MHCSSSFSSSGSVSSVIHMIFFHHSIFGWLRSVSKNQNLPLAKILFCNEGQLDLGFHGSSKCLTF